MQINLLHKRQINEILLCVVWCFSEDIIVYTCLYMNNLNYTFSYLMGLMDRESTCISASDTDKWEQEDFW